MERVREEGREDIWFVSETSYKNGRTRYIHDCMNHIIDCYYAIVQALQPIV